MTFSVLVLGTKAVTQAFEEMMTQVKEGNIQVIITKDCCAIMGLNQKDLENQGILA